MLHTSRYFYITIYKAIKIIAIAIIAIIAIINYVINFN